MAFTPVDWEDAIGSVDSRLKDIRAVNGPGRFSVSLRPPRQTKPLFLFKRYLQDQIGATQFEFRVESEDKNVTEREDEILRHHG